MHLEVRVTQAQRLIHLVALARFTGIRTVDLAVDGHPLVQAFRVEHHVIHLLGRRRDVDLGLHLSSLILHVAQCPFDGRLEAVQAYAEHGGGIVVAREQVVFE